MWKVHTTRYSVIFQNFPSRVRVVQKNPSSIRVAGTRWTLVLGRHIIIVAWSYSIWLFVAFDCLLHFIVCYTQLFVALSQQKTWIFMLMIIWVPALWSWSSTGGVVGVKRHCYDYCRHQSWIWWRYILRAVNFLNLQDNKFPQQFSLLSKVCGIIVLFYFKELFPPPYLPRPHPNSPPQGVTLAALTTTWCPQLSQALSTFSTTRCTAPRLGFGGKLWAAAHPVCVLEESSEPWGVHGILQGA